MGRLDGKVAAVTGGAAGIGEATVRLFVDEGARVAFADRDADRGTSVADEINASGGDVLFVQACLEREAEAMDFIRRTVDHFGHLNILVNNAAVRLYQNVTEASEESWDTIWSVNVKGYAFCAKAAIPALRRAGQGSIVNIASNNALIAGDNTVQYDTTKAAVTGLTRGLARAHAAEGIRANALCPGRTFTDFHEQRAAAAGKTHEAFKEEFGRPTMFKRGQQYHERLPRAYCFWLLTMRRTSPAHACLQTAARQPCNVPGGRKFSTADKVSNALHGRVAWLFDVTESLFKHTLADL